MPSGFGEGFPNALVEAMACGISCIATDVGDASRLVGAAGRIVPLADPDSLGNAIRDFLDLGKEGQAKIGNAARARVMEKFHIDRSVKRYEQFYEDLANPGIFNPVSRA